MDREPKETEENELPSVAFGKADAPLPDWREYDEGDEDEQDDDEETETDPSVIAMLGFDPLELEDEAGDTDQL